MGEGAGGRRLAGCLPFPPPLLVKVGQGPMPSTWETHTPCRSPVDCAGLGVPPERGEVTPSQALWSPEGPILIIWTWRGAGERGRAGLTGHPFRSGGWQPRAQNSTPADPPSSWEGPGSLSQLKEALVGPISGTLSPGGETEGLEGLELPPGQQAGPGMNQNSPHFGQCCTPRYYTPRTRPHVGRPPLCGRCL